MEIIQVRADSFLDPGAGCGSDEKGENLGIFREGSQQGSQWVGCDVRTRVRSRMIPRFLCALTGRME